MLKLYLGDRRLTQLHAFKRKVTTIYSLRVSTFPLSRFVETQAQKECRITRLTSRPQGASTKTSVPPRVKARLLWTERPKRPFVVPT
jgi:hypothetical protein